MRKLVFYIDSMQRGGANRVMANLLHFFSKQGYETVLVNDAPPKPEDMEYAVPTETKRFFLSEGQLNGSLFKRNFTRIKALRKLVENEKPDVTLSFMGPPNVRMLLATLFWPTKKVVSVRNDPYKEYGSGLRKIIANLLFLMAQGVIFQTEDAASYFVSAVRKKSKIIYNPVDPKFYDCNWTPRKKSVAVVGRLEPQKNPMNVILAFQNMSDAFSEYTLDFYGDGSMRPLLEKYVQDNMLSDRVFFHGKCQQVEKILENAALYVLCSDYEGMPNALMEAMAVGVPAISTDCPCGGPKALFSDCEAGLLVPVNDSKKMQLAMERVLPNSDLQMKLSENARLRAREFHPDCIFAQWERYLFSFKKK